MTVTVTYTIQVTATAELIGYDADGNAVVEIDKDDIVDMHSYDYGIVDYLAPAGEPLKPAVPHDILTREELQAAKS